MTTYEYLNLIASYGGLALIYHGIRVMSKNADMRSAESERRHNEAMTDSQRKHDEFMIDSQRREEESKRRHEEAMAESRRREEEGIRRHEESMAALHELIERTR